MRCAPHMETWKPCSGLSFGTVQAGHRWRYGRLDEPVGRRPPAHARARRSDPLGTCVRARTRSAGCCCVPTTTPRVRDVRCELLQCLRRAVPGAIVHARGVRRKRKEEVQLRAGGHARTQTQRRLLYYYVLVPATSVLALVFTCITATAYSYLASTRFTCLRHRHGFPVFFKKT
jgi:hypothetical protein